MREEKKIFKCLYIFSISVHKHICILFSVTLCVEKNENKPVEVISYTVERNLMKIFFTSESMHRHNHLIQQGRWDLDKIGNIVTGSEGEVGYLVYGGGKNETFSGC